MTEVLVPFAVIDAGLGVIVEREVDTAWATVIRTTWEAPPDVARMRDVPLEIAVTTPVIESTAVCAAAESTAQRTWAPVIGLLAPLKTVAVSVVVAPNAVRFAGEA